MSNQMPQAGESKVLIRVRPRGFCAGVVRAVDIDQNNVVLSTEIGQLSIRYFGRGLMKDNLKPGWLIRALNKVF